VFIPAIPRGQALSAAVDIAGMSSRRANRKYYGKRMALFLLATMYISMAGAALVIEWIFQALHLVPSSAKPSFV